MNIRNIVIGAACVLRLAPATLAQNQYSNWLYSSSIYLNTTPTGANLPASALETNFPVVVRLNSSLFNFSQAQTNGADIRFTTAASNALPCEIEQWDAVHGTASIWVLVPSIQGNTNQQLIMYWGKTNATSQSSGPLVFNATNGFCAVLHMNGTSDSTGTLTPTDTGTTPTNGVLGPARYFSGGVELNCGTSITTLPSGNTPHTTEAWFRADASPGTLVGWGVQQQNGKVVVTVASPPQISVDTYFAASLSGRSSLSLSQWYHAAYVYANGTAKVYVNGVLDGSTTGAFNIPSPARMDVGYGANFGDANFTGSLEELRISSLARSTNWLWLEYQNQNPLQTLAGCLPPAGTNFSVSPAAVTMNENTSTNFIAQAGGAQKLYWLIKQNGQATLVAVDQLNYTYSIGRITATLTNIVEFQAVQANGAILTNDVPVTVLHTIPNPGFTLSPSTNLWDGRSLFTVTPLIANLGALQAAGATNLNYQWSVDGVAVTGQSPPSIYTPGSFTGTNLTLLRAQGNGPMTVTLVLDNGGALITNSCVITVQQPVSEAWVGHTPGANEVPVNNQFFARDNTGYGTIYYNGSLAGSPSSVFLNVYANGVLYTNLSQPLSGGQYAFAARIPGGLVTYGVQFGSVANGVTNFLNTVTNLVCGDAYILEGQSNAEATAPGSETNYWPTVYSNSWIRSYGNMDAGGTTNGGWGVASRADWEPKIGYWGMDLASNLWAAYNMPICIINGAVGGTCIIQHQPNPTNHAVPYVINSPGGNNTGEGIYANLLARVTAAGLTNGIRGLLWHQGENDQGAQEGLASGYDYLVYQKHFVNLTAAWKQDFPNLQNYYIFQIWPNACGDASANDMLREGQRTLPNLYSNLRIMSTLGIVPGSSCHYPPAGYQRFSDLMIPLVAQDNYGYVPTNDLTAPRLQQAYFTTNQNEIALVFGQNMVWNGTSTARFFLNYQSPSSPGVAGAVVSGSASGNTVKLELSGTNCQTITYLVGGSWDGVQNNLLYGSNGIAALTFCSVPVAASAANSLITQPATGLTTNSATLNGTLACPGTNFAVYVYWNIFSGGNNPALWTNSAYVGSWSNVVATNLSYPATGLTPNTTYYFTFQGTNAGGNLWAANVQSFTTPALPGPGVDNDGGAANLAVGLAQLRGTLTNGPANVSLYWGAADGGTNAANWANVILLTNTPTGSFAASISNLLYGVTYYYRSYASNHWGAAWAPATTNFTTLRPVLGRGLTNATATALGTGAATLNATLACAGAAYNVYAWWNTVNGGTNAALWTNAAYVGSWTNVTATNLALPVTGLAPNTAYYFTFLATNALDLLWATNVLSFTTLTPPAPTVGNAAGAASLSPGVAQLQGTLTNGPADVRLYWGTADGGANPGAWANTNLLPGVASGAFSSNVSNLLYGLTFYYRGCASNRWGVTWAPATASFTTLRPAAVAAGLIPYSSIVAVSSSSQLSGSGFWGTNAFNGTGLLTDGTCGTTSGEWASAGNQPVSSEWLKVRFDQSYSLNYLRVWAFNEDADLCVTNASVYVINSDSDPGANADQGGGPFNPAGWTALLPNQAFTPNPDSGSGPEINTDPHISLGGVTARQLALQINATANDVGLAGFGQIQIYRLGPAPISLADTAATGIAATTAGLNGTLACAGAVYQVTAYWNPVNGGTNAALWTNSAYVGTWSNLTSTNLSFTATGLGPGTTYYYTLLATNAVDVLWATNVQSFTTLTPPAGTPAITSLSPVSGRTNGGTVVTLTGSNFLAGASVQFGGSGATAVTVNSSTQVLATTPAHGPGLVNVTLLNTNGLSATNLNVFAYVLPPVPPKLSGARQLGTNLVLVWSGGTNQSCVLLSGTNLTQPLANWTPVATNAVGAGGLSTDTISIQAGDRQRFFGFEVVTN